MSGFTLDLGPELLICLDQMAHVMQKMVNYNNIASERPTVLTDPVVSNNGVLMTKEMEKKRKYYHIRKFFCVKFLYEYIF